MNCNFTYKDLFAKIACCIDNKECMLCRCENCPSEQNLLDYTEEFFGDYDEDHQIIYTVVYSIYIFISIR